MRILNVLDHSVPLQSGYTFRTCAILHQQRALGWQTYHVTSPKHYGAVDSEETVDGLHFCDATLYERLKSAGLTEHDTIMLVGHKQHRADAAYRVLQAHPRVVVRNVSKLRGPWHAAVELAWL